MDPGTKMTECCHPVQYPSATVEAEAALAPGVRISHRFEGHIHQHSFPTPENAVWLDYKMY